MANIYQKITTDLRVGPVSVSGKDHMSTEMWVGTGPKDNVLLGIASVKHTHVYNIEKLEHTMLFEYMLNGRTLAKVVFDSNRHGKLGKQRSEGWANIGVMKSRRIK